MDAFIIVLDCALQAAWAIQLREKSRARKWLDDAREPAAKVFPLADPASMGLTLVLGKLREKAAA
jgi:hypothetical protein